MYSKDYYSIHDENSYKSATVILNQLSNYISPSSIIDWGCGSGTWCKAAIEIWNVSIIGIDQHDFDGYQMYISQSNYRKEDIRKEIWVNKVELAICVEVIEHIDEYYEDAVIDNICSCSDTILFSGALPFQGGTGHINEKPYSYWVKKFRERGYNLDDRIRRDIWDNSDVEIWYRNNIMLLKKVKTIKIQEQYPLDIIHPDMLYRILKKRGAI